ncbi:hypothetical protein H671_2g5912 [Cricetulus griseus]|uniref:Uncharacterized protein n=1 Tax=Cricetulus griseus TaxID=10029 RepID=A0A061IJ68_CRIGR|nr:hypothetical protein H671_2g5912 [Cricetulus griseus]
MYASDSPVWESYWRLFFFTRAPRKEDTGSRREDRNKQTSPRLYASFRRNHTTNLKDVYVLFPRTRHEPVEEKKQKTKNKTVYSFIVFSKYRHRKGPHEAIVIPFQ